MNKYLYIILFALCNVISTLNAYAQSVLWYETPARHWLEALPVGNGRMGAMIYGGTSDEVI